MIFFVGGGQSDTRGVTAETVGSKAYNLMRLDRIGLPVPPAFVLSTTFFRQHVSRGEVSPETLAGLFPAALRRLENATGTRLGSRRRPLLVSVRSGAPVSMPGMLETVLNVGLNDRTVHGLIRRTGNPRLAWDSYRRLVQCFAVTVDGCDNEAFDRVVRDRLAAEQLPAVPELDAEALQSITQEYLQLYKDFTGRTFPRNPIDQLVAAAHAVLQSWVSPRARKYRRLHDIDERVGTAVTVQAMVFGNAGGTSGSGVGFTRDPATGADELYLDFLFNAQGEDVVAGRHAVRDTEELAHVLPAVYATLQAVRRKLEAEFGDVQDFEFTVQEGEIFFLQTRTGKRTPWAAVRTALDMVDQGLIDQATAVERVAGYDLDTLVRTRLVTNGAQPVGRATPAGMGVAVGAIALDPSRAEALRAQGRRVVLVREATSPEDIGGIAVAEGILTAAGGRTSHAAVVARQMGKVCLVGCDELEIEAAQRRVTIGGQVFAEGDHLSLDGESGEIFAGELEVIGERPVRELETIRQWRRRSATGSRVAPVGR